MKGVSLEISEKWESNSFKIPLQHWIDTADSNYDLD